MNEVFTQVFLFNIFVMFAKYLMRQFSLMLTFCDTEPTFSISWTQSLTDFLGFISKPRLKVTHFTLWCCLYTHASVYSGRELYNARSYRTP
jgi:hypothetical protein